MQRVLEAQPAELDREVHGLASLGLASRSASARPARLRGALARPDHARASNTGPSVQAQRYFGRGSVGALDPDHAAEAGADAASHPGIEAHLGRAARAAAARRATACSMASGPQA